MSTIFVTAEDPAYDYTPALEYGKQLVGVFPPGQIHLHPQVALAQARKVLADMSADDYLALSGDPVKIAVCAIVASEKMFVVKFLRWNRQTRSYVPISVDFSEQSPK